MKNKGMKKLLSEVQKSRVANYTRTHQSSYVSKQIELEGQSCTRRISEYDNLGNWSFTVLGPAKPMILYGPSHLSESLQEACVKCRFSVAS